MRILDLYRDYSVEHITEGNRHTTEGWVNTHCPFCPGSRDWHLGYNTSDNYFHCWRCGGHSIRSTLVELLRIPSDQITQVIRDYGGADRALPPSPTPTINLKTFKYPSNTGTLNTAHRRYLEDRNFDPDRIHTLWHIAGTGPASFLDGKNYSHRILAPIHWETKAVSFQARTILDRGQPKYKACPKDREIVHHQNILYGMPRKWTPRGVCVEGITDVWRLGARAFAVFGIAWTLQQARIMAKRFDEVVIVFDPEEQAQIQARKLLKSLEGYRVKAYIENIQTDPGSLSPDDAHHLIKSIYHG